MSDYTDNGFASRRAYLESLCEEYDRDKVYTLASLLGPSEDFDGLVTALEDDADFDAADYAAALEAAKPTAMGGLDHAGLECVLVDDTTGEPIPRNTVREGRSIVGGRPPQHSASTGRVWTVDADGLRGEFFPSVVNARWIYA